jgi:multisubunit Na+/H+ antiporter MnhB subunit
MFTGVMLLVVVIILMVLGGFSYAVEQTPQHRTLTLMLVTLMLLALAVLCGWTLGNLWSHAQTWDDFK